MTSQARRWCFTLNNPTPEEEAELTCFEDWPHTKYGVFQYERGETGTLHAQGYVEFTTPKRLGAVKGMLERAHWEVARGSCEDNTKYCTKEEGRERGPFSFGNKEASGQGKRNELVAVQEMLKRGADDREIAERFFGSWVRYHGAFREYRDMAVPKRNWPMFVVCLCGPTGTGKSRAAFELAGDAYVQAGGEWFDGYDGQRVVILDEFCGNLPWHFLLRLLDRNPMKVPVKGNFREFVARTVIITSNRRPEEWYDREKFGDVFGALFRRISLFLWLDYTEESSVCKVGPYTEF